MAWLELTDTSEVAVAWYGSVRTGNFLAAVFRDHAEAPWRAFVRRRVYVDDKAFDSDDVTDGAEIASGHADPASDAARDALVVATQVAFTHLETLGAVVTRVDAYCGAFQFALIWSEQSFNTTRWPVPVSAAVN